MAQEKTNLVIPRGVAEERINSRIQEGIRIKDISIQTKNSLERAKAEYNKWNRFNAELLKGIFDTLELSLEYEGSIYWFGAMPREINWRIGIFRKQVQKKIDALESIKERLELYDEPGKKTVVKKEETKKLLSSKVFIVHGHDDAARLSVDSFLRRLDLEPIVLHEKPNKGRTIIEKFEDYSDVGFAIVLLTADDEGRKKQDEEHEEELKPRARQNVIFELGFFIGRLRRKNVCPMYKEGVELPSDYKGVVYTLLDDSGACD